jgi:hypothetical protein
MAKGKLYPWWGWVLFAALVGMAVYHNWPRHEITPEEGRALSAAADRDIQREAERRCQGVSDRLMDACIAAMKERIDYEDRVLYYQEQDER